MFFYEELRLTAAPLCQSFPPPKNKNKKHPNVFLQQKQQHFMWCM